MKIREVIEKILEYHPVLPKETIIDRVLAGDPEQECTGIVTTCCCSVEVIRKAAELGANLIIPHEPLFWTHQGFTDWIEDSDVYQEKLKLLNENGIVVFRDHDHIHYHRPDGIRYGVMQELGWTKYCQTDLMTRERTRLSFKLPPTPLREIVSLFKEKLGLEYVRVVGNTEAVIENVVFCGHIEFNNETAATSILKEDGVDLLIPGEMIDWTAANFARDAAQLGKNKAILHLGHFNSEELGMKYAANWVVDLTDHKVPVTFVPSADIYHYL